MIYFLIISASFAWFFIVLFSPKFDYLDERTNETDSRSSTGEQSSGTSEGQSISELYVSAVDYIKG